MNTKEYCETVADTFSNLKHELSDLLRDAENISGCDPSLAGKINVLVEEIESKMDMFTNECPTSSFPKNEIQRTPETGDCIVKMSVWDPEHILPEDM